jgi:glutamate racemase
VAGSAASAAAPAAPKPAVGFFDSGVGGLSVARAFLRLRPAARVLYTADWAFCPYGARPDAEILARAREVLAGLVALGARLAVVACNSASAVALEALRAENPGLPIVGMEPAVKPAAALSRTGAVGILATAHTLRGRLFRETSARFAAGVRVVPAVGEGFVELVESGDLSSPAARATVERVLAPLLAANCDPIVLGCTHYPFLLPLLRAAAPGTTFLDPSEAVARRAAALYDALPPA